MKINVMSFNILCGGDGIKNYVPRRPLVVETIRSHAPDTFGLQEAHWDWMTCVTGGLEGYAYVGVGREDGKRDGEFSPVFYRTDRFELIDSGSFWLSETPEKPGKGWDAACVRICSYAVLEDRAEGKRFVHMNTHLDHIGPVAMQKGAELIAERAEAFGGLPVILTGDFNVTPGSAPYKAVINGGFEDCAIAAPGADSGKTFHDFGRSEGSFIDYIFIKNGAKALSFRIVRDEPDGRLPSDHYPVTAEIEL